MAKPLVLSFGGAEIPCPLCKVERSDLYGFVEIETLDEQGRKCTLATLADDGRRVIASGGTSFASLSPEGHWVEKKTLIPTDNQGKRMTPVPSSYSGPVALEKTATIDEYLSHDIRAVYQIASEVDLSPIMDELKKGTIYQFPYSFRGGRHAVHRDWIADATGIRRPFRERRRGGRGRERRRGRGIDRFWNDVIGGKRHGHDQHCQQQRPRRSGGIADCSAAD